MEIRRQPCRDCGASISFTVAEGGRWVPCETDSLTDHRRVGPKIVYEPARGHVMHTCARRAPAARTAASPSAIARLRKILVEVQALLGELEER